MTEPVFVDTNVLVYALDERDPRKQVAAWSWRQELCRTGRGPISCQVLQECYVQLLRVWPDDCVSSESDGSGISFDGGSTAGQELHGVKVLNPFLTEPAALGGW
jgi:hypothetical protein